VNWTAEEYLEEDRRNGTCYNVALGLGVISGMRCMSPLAVIAHQAGQERNAALRRTIFARPATAQIVQLLSLSEMVFGKFPVGASRTSLPALIARGAAGAFVGATVCGAHQRDETRGAVLGATGAVASALVTGLVGHVLTKHLHVPRFLVTLTEDTVSLVGGLVLLEILKQDAQG